MRISRMFKVVQVCTMELNYRAFCLLLSMNQGFHSLGENSAMGATYNSLERQRLDAPKWHPNTRVAVMNKLISWIK